MLRFSSSLVKGDGFKQKIPDSLCILVGSGNRLGLRSHQPVFFFFILSVLSGLL